jgi:hypothetical protein
MHSTMLGDILLCESWFWPFGSSSSTRNSVCMDMYCGYISYYSSQTKRKSHNHSALDNSQHSALEKTSTRRKIHNTIYLHHPTQAVTAANFSAKSSLRLLLSASKNGFSPILTVLTPYLSPCPSIIRRRMERRPIIPNRNIIHILPLEPNLQTMVINQQSPKPLQQRLAL